MKRNIKTILMADIIQSGYFDQKHLIQDFQNVVSLANAHYKTSLRSPLTITLGDEFQGIPKTLYDALQLVIYLEETIIRHHYTFQLRYVIHQGTIDTPINKNIGYGMLGSGLTNARSALTTLKKSQHRFLVETGNSQHDHALNQAFVIYQSLIDAWRPDKDYATVVGFLEEADYKLVAQRIGQNYSQTWKKQRTLKIDEYQAAKELITYLGEIAA